MPNDQPLVSVITIVYNDADHLEATICSVLEQDYENIEYVVIDGGSSDGSVEIIKKYEDSISYWVSEKDNGISEAFNKGIQASHGEILNFLNSADLFFDRNSVSKSVDCFLNHGVNIMAGYAKYQDRTIPGEPLLNEHPLYKKARISHQASFVKKSVFEDVGNFPENYKIRMDYDFWLRALRRHDFYFLPENLVIYAEGGVSGQEVTLFYVEEMISNFKHLDFKDFLKRFPVTTYKLLSNWLRGNF